jgi:hypothetical protein
MAPGVTTCNGGQKSDHNVAYTGTMIVLFWFHWFPLVSSFCGGSNESARQIATEGCYAGPKQQACSVITHSDASVASVKWVTSALHSLHMKMDRSGITDARLARAASGTFSMRVMIA